MTDVIAGANAPRRKLTAALMQRVSSGLHLGLLRYGDRLPSTRTLAREFSVDPRVVLASYRSLEARGIVELRARSGIYVAAPAASGKASAPIESAWLIDVLADAMGHGVPALDFSERVRRSMQTLRLRATVLECNDDQLFSVSDELKADYGLDVSIVDIDSMNGDLPVEARQADCVVTTAAHAEEGRQTAQQLGVPSLVLSMCDDLFAEVERLLQLEEVYFVVTDTRFEAKLKRIFQDIPGSHNLRVLINGHDDLDSIPVTAPAYLTRLTRRNIGAAPLLQRVIPEARVFNDSSIRMVLDFVVNANLEVMRARA